MKYGVFRMLIQYNFHCCCCCCRSLCSRSWSCSWSCHFLVLVVLLLLLLFWLVSLAGASLILASHVCIYHHGLLKKPIRPSKVLQWQCDLNCWYKKLCDYILHTLFMQFHVQKMKSTDSPHDIITFVNPSTGCFSKSCFISILAHPPLAETKLRGSNLQLVGVNKIQYSLPTPDVPGERRLKVTRSMRG